MLQFLRDKFQEHPISWAIGTIVSLGTIVLAVISMLLNHEANKFALRDITVQNLHTRNDILAEKVGKLESQTEVLQENYDALKSDYDIEIGELRFEIEERASESGAIYGTLIIARDLLDELLVDEVTSPSEIGSIEIKNDQGVQVLPYLKLSLVLDADRFVVRANEAVIAASVRESAMVRARDRLCKVEVTEDDSTLPLAERNQVPSIRAVVNWKCWELTK